MRFLLQVPVSLTSVVLGSIDTDSVAHMKTLIRVITYLITYPDMFLLPVRGTGVYWKMLEGCMTRLYIWPEGARDFVSYHPPTTAPL